MEDGGKADLDLSLGNSNIKGLESEGPSGVKNKYSRVKGTKDYATANQ